MENENENDKIKLEWEIYLHDKKNYQTTQIIQTVTKDNIGDKELDTYFEYFADIEYVNCQIKKDYKPTQVFSSLLKWCDCDSKNKSDRSLYLCFCFLSFYAYLIKRLALCFLNEKSNKEDLDLIKLLLNKHRTKIDKDNIQAIISEKCCRLSEIFNQIQFALCKNVGWEDIKKQIEDICKKLSDEDVCLKGLFNEYVANKRCVAWYEFDDNKRKSLISFSGFSVDCDDATIMKYLRDIKATMPEVLFVTSIKKLSDNLHLELVQINTKVSRYYAKVTHPPFSLTCKKNGTLQKEIKNFYSTGKKVIPREFSCCERKLFTKFTARKNNHGHLYVTKPPCCKCVSAIWYFREMGIGIQCTVIDP